MREPPASEQSLAALATNLAALTDPVQQLAARLLARQEALTLHYQSRRYITDAKLFDSVARFGGGSLLTAVLLLMLGGKHDLGVIAFAALTLLCFVGGVIWSIRKELKAIGADHAADRLDAVLKETER